MQPRIDYAKVAPEVRAALKTLDDHVRETDLDRGLIELVKLRGTAPPCRSTRLRLMLASR